jgi:hypothetical protein
MGPGDKDASLAGPDAQVKDLMTRNPLLSRPLRSNSTRKSSTDASVGRPSSSATGATIVLRANLALVELKICPQPIDNYPAFYYPGGHT